MQKNHLQIILVFFLGVLLCNVQPASAFPPIPSGFYGTVKIDGANVPSGTRISARINGVEYAFTTVTTVQGSTAYSVDVPGDETDTPGTIEGGKAGDTVVFFIGSVQAAQTAAWRSGSNVYLNLTGSTTGNHAPLITEGPTVEILMSQNGLTKPFGLTLHATDADGDALTWSLLSGAKHGTAATNGTGASVAVTYSPTVDYCGPDVFYVQVADDEGGTAMIMVNVDIRYFLYFPVIGN